METMIQLDTLALPICSFARMMRFAKLTASYVLAAEEAHKVGNEELLVRCESSVMKLLNHLQDRGPDYGTTLRSMTLDGSVIAEAMGEQQLAALGNACPRVVAWLENKNSALPQYAEINTPVRDYDIA